MKDYEITRGDVYYVFKFDGETGSEQKSGRPAVVVSNNQNNKYSKTVEIVYCTTKQKTPLPTHVVINATPVQSTVLCEQITSVSVERLGCFIGCCNAEEMEQIDKALSISLGIDVLNTTENDTTKTKDDDVSNCENLREEPVLKTDVIKLQVERDTYKNMYEQLLNKLMPK